MRPAKPALRGPVIKVFHHHYYHQPVTHHHTHTHAHKDKYVHVRRPAVPTMANRRHRVVSTDARIDRDKQPDANDAQPKGFKGYLKRAYDKCLPTLSFLAKAVLFVGGRINFGFGYKVSWLPFVGFGAP